MSPLRFRAWDRVRKVMVNDPYNMAIKFDGSLVKAGLDSYCGDPECCGSPSPEFDYLNREQWFVMQSTGLHDAKGVEIFEGDVVVKRCKFPAYERIGVVQWGRDDKDTGMWERKTVRFAGNDPKLNRDLAEPHYEPFGLACGCDELEVIGNRWQNPDLLHSAV